MPCRSGDPSGHGLSAIARPGQGHRHLARFSGSSVISRRGLPRGIVVFRMELSPQLYSRARAPRVKLAGSVLALLRLENCRQVQGRLHQLSITGGLLHLPEPLEEQVTVEIMFHLGSTTVRARAETIFPMWATQGCLQPFRFTELPDHERHKLDTDLQRLLGRLASGKEKPAGGTKHDCHRPYLARWFSTSTARKMRFTWHCRSVRFFSVTTSPALAKKQSNWRGKSAR